MIIKHKEKKNTLRLSDKESLVISMVQNWPCNQLHSSQLLQLSQAREIGRGENHTSAYKENQFLGLGWL